MIAYLYNMLCLTISRNESINHFVRFHCTFFGLEIPLPMNLKIVNINIVENVYKHVIVFKHIQRGSNILLHTLIGYVTKGGKLLSHYPITTNNDIDHSCVVEQYLPTSTSTKSSVQLKKEYIDVHYQTSSFRFTIYEFEKDEFYYLPNCITTLVYTI